MELMIIEHFSILEVMSDFICQYYMIQAILQGICYYQCYNFKGHFDMVILTFLHRFSKQMKPFLKYPQIFKIVFSVFTDILNTIFHYINYLYCHYKFCSYIHVGSTDVKWTFTNWPVMVIVGVVLIILVKNYFIMTSLIT